MSRLDDNLKLVNVNQGGCTSVVQLKRSIFVLLLTTLLCNVRVYAQQQQEQRIVNVSCASEPFIINQSHQRFVFENAACAINQSIVFVFDVPRGLPTEIQKPTMLEDVSIVVQNVAALVSVRTHANLTEGMRAVIADVKIYMRNVTMDLGGATEYALRVALGESVPPGGPTAASSRVNTWSLFLQPSDLIEVENLEIVLSSVFVMGRTGARALGGASILPAKYLDPLLLLRGLTLRNVSLTLYNTTIDANTTSTSIALIGKTLVETIRISIVGSKLSMMCAGQKGVVPVLILWDGGDGASSARVDAIRGVHVDIDRSSISWTIVPNSTLHGHIQGFPPHQSSFGIKHTYGGVVAVSLYVPSKYTSPSMRSLNLSCERSNLSFVVSGNATEVIANGQEGIGAAVFCISGNFYANDALSDSVIVLKQSSVVITSSASTVIRVEYFLDGVKNIRIVVEDLSGCVLRSQLPLFDTWSSAIASIVYVAFTSLEQHSAIVVARVTSRHIVASGDANPTKKASLVNLVTSSAVALTNCSDTSVVIRSVAVVCAFWEGRVLPMDFDDGRYVFPLASLVVAAGLLLTNAKYDMGANASFIVQSSAISVTAVRLTLDMNHPTSYGIIAVDTSAVSLGGNCPFGVHVDVQNVSVFIQASSFSVVETPAPSSAVPHRDYSLVRVLFYASLVTLQVPMPLFVALIKTMSSVLGQLTVDLILQSLPLTQLSAGHISGQAWIRVGGGSSLEIDSSTSSVDPGTEHRMNALECGLNRCRNPSVTGIDRGGGGCVVNASLTFLGRLIDGGSTVVMTDQVRVIVRPATKQPPHPADPCSSVVDVETVSVFAAATYLQTNVSSDASLRMHRAHVTISPSSTTLIISPLAVMGLRGLVLPKLSFSDGASLVATESNFTSTGRLLPSITGGAALARHVQQRLLDANTIEFHDARVLIRSCVFNGFDHLFEAPNSAGSLVQWTGSSELLLGCNMWGGLLFPDSKSSWAPLDGVPRWSRVFNDSGPSAIAGCNPLDKLFSASVTTTSTVSAIPPIHPAPVILPAITPNAAILAMAAADGIPLIALGQSACGPPELKKATSSTRYLLSPFFDYGGEVAALGNAGLIVGIVVVHALLTLILEKCGKLDRNSEIGRHKYRRLFSSSSATSRTWIPSNAAVRTHFPNASILAVIFILNGTGFTAANVLSRGRMVSFSLDQVEWSVVAGSVAMAVMCAPVVLLWHVERGGWKRLHHGLRFRSYPLCVRRNVKFLPACVLPLGRWEPAELRATVGKLRGLARDGPFCARWALTPALLALATNTLLGIEGPESWWCPVQWTLLTALTLFGAVVFAFYRPCRIPVVNVILVAQYILQACIFVVSALVQSGVGSSTTDNDSSSIVTLLMALSTMYTMLSIVKICHLIVVVLWERTRSTTDDHAPKWNALLMPVRQRRREHSNSERGTVFSDRSTVDSLFLNFPADNRRQEPAPISTNNNGGSMEPSDDGIVIHLGELLRRRRWSFSQCRRGRVEPDGSDSAFALSTSTIPAVTLVGLDAAGANRCHPLSDTDRIVMLDKLLQMISRNRCSGA